ncbi:STM4015 family protein [Actinomadura fibrosa]|uniref:STM4015 family protein n=1 Tax=Actinomadura fibrosa TaxID=111802 RepID=A0ABW2XFW0_9ACTN|nr:STM4015 family protein [Actinomadura fibrosa]
MTLSAPLEEFAGLRAVTVDGPPEPGDGPLPEPGEVAWAIRQRERDGRWIGTFAEAFDWFLGNVDTAQVTHLVVGYWDHDLDLHTLLIEVAGRFPRLRALFLGDILDWELHISWIQHGDITPLLAAYPDLEHLEIRGASDLAFEPLRSERLKVLRIESGGLPAEVARAVAASDLPALEHLDLWFGSEWYDGTTSYDDVAPLLTGERLPALRHLGLENGPFQDELAEGLASAPVVARLESLSLAMGMLTDRGAEALLTGQPLTHLRRLDLHHHFLSGEMQERLRAALPGVEVDLDDGRGEPDWLDIGYPPSSALYIAVSE